jgi:hypothetical protein
MMSIIELLQLVPQTEEKLEPISILMLLESNANICVPPLTTSISNRNLLEYGQMLPNGQEELFQLMERMF